MPFYYTTAAVAVVFLLRCTSQFPSLAIGKLTTDLCQEFTTSLLVASGGASSTVPLYGPWLPSYWLVPCLSSVPPPLCNYLHHTPFWILLYLSRHLDNHSLWEGKTFAVRCFKIIMYSIQVRHLTPGALSRHLLSVPSLSCCLFFPLCNSYGLSYRSIYICKSVCKSVMYANHHPPVPLSSSLPHQVEY